VSAKSNPLHVVVLMGGWSAEREVSLTSGEAVVKALQSKGYRVSAVDVTPDVAAKIAALKPDVVFNALHGRFGEDGTVQGLLEMMQLPYTHSGVLASALAMHKPQAKVQFEKAGLPVAEGAVVRKLDVISGQVPIALPYVIKPMDEGSSVGVHMVREGSNLHFTESNWPYGDEVLVERFVAGREVQAAVLDGKALGAIEIRPKGEFYDYETKYTEGLAEHVMPAPIDALAYERILRYAEAAHECLGCRGLTRSDFIYDESKGLDDGIILLETNTQPGMTPLSLAPEIAAHAGIAFNELVDRLVQLALRDMPKNLNAQANEEVRHAKA
jgi:D-alanine-D-alanine ligase